MLDEVKCPEGLEFLWNWYLDLAASRQLSGMGSPQAIPPSEIVAWQQLMRIDLEPWQVRAIRLLDIAHLKAFAETRESTE
jgi:hypothetical protein